jgi:hypothetical protein
MIEVEAGSGMNEEEEENAAREKEESDAKEALHGDRQEQGEGNAPAGRDATIGEEALAMTAEASESDADPEGVASAERGAASGEGMDREENAEPEGVASVERGAVPVVASVEAKVAGAAGKGMNVAEDGMPEEEVLPEETMHEEGVREIGIQASDHPAERGLRGRAGSVAGGATMTTAG